MESLCIFLVNLLIIFFASPTHSSQVKGHLPLSCGVPRTRNSACQMAFVIERNKGMMAPEELVQMSSVEDSSVQAILLISPNKNEMA